MKCDQWLIRWQLPSSRPADDYSRSARASDPALGFRGVPPGPERDRYRATCLISRLLRCKDLPPARHTISHPVIFITQGWWSFLEDPHFYTFPSSPGSFSHQVIRPSGWSLASQVEDVAGGERSPSCDTVPRGIFCRRMKELALVISYT